MLSTSRILDSLQVTVFSMHREVIIIIIIILFGKSVLLLLLLLSEC